MVMAGMGMESKPRPGSCTHDGNATVLYAIQPPHDAHIRQSQSSPNRLKNGLDKSKKLAKILFVSV